MTYKECSKCHETKPLSDFYKRQASKDGYQPCCRICDIERGRKLRKKYPGRYSDSTRKWKESHKERINFLNRRSFLKTRYGITTEKYDELFDSQYGKCAICGKAGKRFTTNGRKDSLEIDHCHQKQNVRGLLCRKCNMALGLLGDSPQLLHGALAYINKI